MLGMAYKNVNYPLHVIVTEERSYGSVIGMTVQPVDGGTLISYNYFDESSLLNPRHYAEISREEFLVEYRKAVEQQIETLENL